MKEIWRDVVGYEGIYQVSNLGNVKNSRGHILKPSNTSTGYPGLTLCKNKERKTTPIHRMVAIAFLPNPENKPSVNHIDGNKENSVLSNLEWATAKENTRHAIHNGIMKVSGRDHPFFGRKHKEESLRKMSIATSKRVGALHFRSKPVYQIDRTSGEIIAEFENQSIAAKTLKTSQGNIGSVLLGKRNHAGGYIWKYKD